MTPLTSIKASLPHLQPIYNHNSHIQKHSSHNQNTLKNVTTSTLSMAPLLILALLSFASVSIAEDRAHGLDSVSPVVVSPQAYAFFNPNALQPTTSKPCDSSHCSTLPLAATVQSAPAHESKSPSTGSHKLGAGGIAGISLSFLFVALVGMGVYHVVTKRKANLERAKPEEV